MCACVWACDMHPCGGEASVAATPRGQERGARSTTVRGGEGRAGPGREGRRASSNGGGTWSEAGSLLAACLSTLDSLGGRGTRCGPFGDYQE